MAFPSCHHQCRLTPAPHPTLSQLRTCLRRKRVAFASFKQWYWDSFSSEVQSTLLRMFHTADAAATCAWPSSPHATQPIRAPSASLTAAARAAADAVLAGAVPGWSDGCVQPHRHLHLQGPSGSYHGASDVPVWEGGLRGCEAGVPQQRDTAPVFRHEEGVWRGAPGCAGDVMGPHCAVLGDAQGVLAGQSGALQHGQPAAQPTLAQHPGAGHRQVRSRAPGVSFASTTASNSHTSANPDAWAISARVSPSFAAVPPCGVFGVPPWPGHPGVPTQGSTTWGQQGRGMSVGRPQHTRPSAPSPIPSKVRYVSGWLEQQLQAVGGAREGAPCTPRSTVGSAMTGEAASSAHSQLGAAGEWRLGAEASLQTHTSASNEGAVHGRVCSDLGTVQGHLCAASPQSAVQQAENVKRQAGYGSTQSLASKLGLRPL